MSQAPRSVGEPNQAPVGDPKAKPAYEDRLVLEQGADSVPRAQPAHEGRLVVGQGADSVPRVDPAREGRLVALDADSVPRAEPAHEGRLVVGQGAASVPTTEPPRENKIFVAQRAAPLPEPPQPLPARLQETSAELIFGLRRLLRTAVEDFRNRDRFYRWKVGIVATWLALSLLSFRIATSGPDDPSANSLGAYVALTHTAMGWGLLLDNRSDSAWQSVRVVVNGEWIHERPLIDADEKVVLGPMQFRKGDATPPAELHLDTVQISTHRASVRPHVVR